jgi:hypothetical protein
MVHQEGYAKLGVLQIGDSDTLDLPTEVCEVDHPIISDAASETSEILSLTTTRKWEIEQWTSNVASEPDPAILEVGSLTLTEEAMMGGYPSIQRDSLVLPKVNHRDEATTHVITLVTLIYLPATFVAVSLLDPYGRAISSDLS